MSLGRLFKNLINTLFAVLYLSGLSAQGPAWTYTPTNNQHIFNFPSSVIVCSEDTLEVGDYLGIFYDSSGTLACGGYFIWLGGNQQVTAYGDDTLTIPKEGFSVEEEIIWKSFQFDVGLEYIHSASYAHTPFYPDSGYFEINGASELVYLGNCVSPIITVYTNNTSCYGTSDGWAAVDIYELNPPYTTTWSDGTIGDTVMGLPAGVHFINVANSLGYVSSQSLVIGHPDSIQLQITNIPVTIPGMPNGQVHLDVSGGTSPFHFTWNNGTTLQNLINVFSGFYTVEVLDSNYCYAIDSTELLTIVPVPWNPVITPLYHEVTVSGLTQLFFNEDGLQTGDVIGVFYDSLGIDVCAGFVSFEGSFDITGSTIHCYGDNPATPDFDGFGPLEEFKWKIWDASLGIQTDVFPDYLVNSQYPDSGFFIPGGSSALTILSNIEFDLGLNTIINPDTYCALTANEIISVEVFSEGMSVTGPFDIKFSINGGPWQSETINQSLFYHDTIQVDLSTPVNLITPINYHIIVVVEAAGDLNLDNDTAFIDLYPLVSSSYIIQDTMNNCVGSAGVIVTGGEPPYSFIWDDPSTQQTALASGLCAGLYNVIITDSGGCVISQFANITNVHPPVFTSEYADVICYGANNGFINLTMSSFQFPLNYLWSNGSLSEDLFNIGPGTYIVTITDGTLLSTIDTFIITQPDSIIINSSVTNILCFDDTTGSIFLDVEGGVEPYSFLWSNGATTKDIISLSSNQYGVTIQDTNDCTKHLVFEIFQPGEIFTAYNILNVTAAGACDGSIYMTVSGGTQPYSFEWSTGSTNEDLEQICGGYYTLRITDQNNCEYFIPGILVNQPQPVLEGNVYLGPNLMSDGVVILYYEYSDLKYSAIEYQHVSSGRYSFTIDPYNSFVVYAIPNPLYNFNFYPIYFPTYYGSKINWEESDIIKTDFDLLNADIYLDSYDSIFFGYGSVSGSVSFVFTDDYENDIYGNQWFDSIFVRNDELFSAMNIPLVLFQSDGQPVSFCLSDNEGKFKFRNVKYGDYILHAEKTGFKTHDRHIFIDSESPDYTEIEVLIYTGNIYMGVDDEILSGDMINVYPNPAMDVIHLETDENHISQKNISIYKYSGEIVNDFTMESGNINISRLSGGLYILKVNSGAAVYYYRFIKIK